MKKMRNIKKGMIKIKKVTYGVVMIAVVMTFIATMTSPVAASVKTAQQTITRYGQDFIVNYDNITIWLDGTSASAIVGQVIQFYNATGGASGKVKLTGISDNNAGKVKYSDPDGRIDTSGMKTGDYNVTGEAAGCNATIISLGEATMKLKLKKGTTTISSVPQGTRITVKFTNSLDPYDGVTLKVTDPDGNILKTNPADGTVFEEVNVTHVTDLEINTAGWELGTYKFKIFTEEEYARGLGKESNEVSLEIVSPELKIEAAKTEVVVSEKVKLTVNGVPEHNISLSIERGAEHAKFPSNLNDNPGLRNIGNFTYTDSIDADGKMEYVIYFDEIGTYTVKVKDIDSGAEDSVDISVSKKRVTFTMPSQCVIGADLVVNGTSNVGKTVDIAIEDRIVKVDVPIDQKGRFEADLPTPDTYGTDFEGPIELKAFIDGNFSMGEDVSGESDDGSIKILMISGTLTAEASTTMVAPGDSLTLSGTAPGSKVVDILIVAPRGGGGHGMNPGNSIDNNLPDGIVYETASVGSDFKWSVELDIDEDADTGTYIAFILSPGKNGIYDGLDTVDLLEGLKREYLGGDLYVLATKTQEQINATLWDATAGAAGSDDFMLRIPLTIGRPEVRLYSIQDVVIGDELVVMGTSNREGQTLIVRVKGPVDLGTKFAAVADGRFKVNFSTYEALTGTYTVEADDGEGHTDTTTLNIVAPARASASSTPTPETTESSAAYATPASTPLQHNEHSNSNSSSNASTPGFETVFMIMALLIAVLRKSR